MVTEIMASEMNEMIQFNGKHFDTAELLRNSNVLYTQTRHIIDILQIVS